MGLFKGLFPFASDQYGFLLFFEEKTNKSKQIL